MLALIGPARLAVAVRFHPIVLTAPALAVGGLVIVLDPIFQGLAVSMVFGVVVSTALELVVIPMLHCIYLKVTGAAPATANRA